MTTVALIHGQCKTRLWGLDSETRIQRQLKTAGVGLVSSVEAAESAERVLVLNANYLFELLTVEGMCGKDDCALLDGEGGLAAINCRGSQVSQAAAAMTDDLEMPEGLQQISTAALAGYNRRLRKTQAPLLEHIDEAEREALESLLYGNAYKGITDLVTKWWWPRPARVITGWCARVGITPNQVTLTGFALVIAAYYLFANGFYVAGLCCGWVMTLLDTVDGKLARVTVNSSKIGHLLDHGLDLIHPPFWYVAWGASLVGSGGLWGFSTIDGCWLVALGYIGGRLIEILFHTLGACGMFAWRPFDAWFRLITARRNPCLIILTLALLVDSPAMAFWGVVGWTVISTAITTLRLIYAAGYRVIHGPLDSWLKQADAAARFPRTYAEFSGTRGAFR